MSDAETGVTATPEGVDTYARVRQAEALESVAEAIEEQNEILCRLVDGVVHPPGGRR